jgi:multiple sugar transport system permease protein
VLNYTIILAAAFVTSLPMIILFLLGQRWIVSGMRPSSGIK